MPVSRNTRGLPTKQSKPINKVPGVENHRPETQEDATQSKRSPSSPQGGPKKRSAFGDLTNANKNQVAVPKKKEGQEGTKQGVKKTQKNVVLQGVSKCNEINLKKSSSKTSPEEIKEEEHTTNEKRISPVKQQTKGCKGEKLSKEKTAVVDDVDKENLDDPFMNAVYAKDIFDYMKEREVKFKLPDYMEKQEDITQDMRGILIDWMVEVQENFELNHETLYLAVKLVDHYLAECICKRETLQLIGSTAILIASKFEERCPPCVDDFLYICDDAYKRDELLTMEINILRTLMFDINIPVPYRFLRRYAKCAHANMETLTLARYICELTLQNYDFVQERSSHLAAACLYLAMKMKNLGGWSPTLEYYSGYKGMDLHSLVKRLNFMITYQADEKLKAVRSKYSHKVFFSVAKIKPLDMLRLEEMLKS